MKKLLSILLAVAMLATLAFAAVTVRPGTKLEFPMYGSGNLGPSDEGVVIDNITTGGSNSWSGTKDYNGTNFTVSTIKWTSGSDLVKSVTIDSDGYLVITLKENYTLLESKGKTIAGTFKITEKGKSTANNYEIGANPDEVTVGYDYEEIFLDDPSLGLPDEGTVYGAVKNNDATYGTVSFSDALGNDISVRMYEKEKFYLYSNTTPNLDIVKKYDDTNAELDFVNFPAKPTFSSTATYYIYAEKDEYVYAIQDGKLVASGAKWDSDEGCWILKTRTLGSYVISDRRLSVASTSTTGDSTTGNTIATTPDTGANDVVGIAAALAVAALISAAAVSLKK